MSLVLAIQQKDKYILASDTAVCTTINDIPYRVKDLSLSKTYIHNNTAYFFAGDVNLSIKVKDEFFAHSDKSVDKLKSIAKKEWSRHSNDDIYIAVFGFDRNGHTKTTIFSSGTNFDDVVYLGHKRDQYIAFGFKMHDILPIFNKNMLQYNNPKQAMISSFNSICCEEVGGQIEIHDLSCQNYSYHKHCIDEDANFRFVKMNAYFKGSGHDAYPASVWGLGSGVGSDDDFSGIGKGYLYKDNDNYVFKYNARVSGDQRQVTLSDQGINIDVANGIFKATAKDHNINANGTIKLETSAGSYIELKPNGDIHIHSNGDLRLTGNRIDLNT